MKKVAIFAIISEVELHWKPITQYSVAEHRTKYINGIYSIVDTPEAISNIFDTYAADLEKQLYKDRPKEFINHNLTITLKVKHIARLN